MNSKVNAIKSYFAYLFDVFFDVVCIVLIKILTYLTFIPYALNHLILVQKMNHTFFIFRKTLPPKRGEKLKKILIKHSKVFAWTYEDMPGIDRDIAQYYIPTKEGCKPVKQKLKRLKPESA